MNATDQRRARRRQRRLALAGLVGPIGFAAGVVAAGATWDDYSHRIHDISDLGGTAAPYAVAQNVNFAVLGVLVVVFAIGLHRAGLGARSAGAAPLLVGYFGVAVVVLGLAPCTPGCDDGTPTDVIHIVAALSGFLALIVAPLLVWRRTRAVPGGTAYAAYSAATGVSAAVFLVAWSVASEVDPERLYAGVLQRLLVGVLLLWIAVTAVRLLRPARG